ncbi:hypothetical protein [Haloarcula litorea]|uniref:hypothetical protein n=1 Tax=Haloarcula litorea TaxID=3032579 RepID=UPI0023E7E335|nr:hypothetical protein [Halomicroarcula sp. GDY20]
MPTTRRTALSAVLALCVVLAGVAAVWGAEQRALAAEADHVRDRLDGATCLTDGGVNEGAGPSRSARVTGVSPGGLRVSVTLPYAYTVGAGDDRVFADTASEAVYEVGPLGVRRVRGTEIDPC